MRVRSILWLVTISSALTLSSLARASAPTFGDDLQREINTVQLVCKDDRHSPKAPCGSPFIDPIAYAIASTSCAPPLTTNRCAPLKSSKSIRGTLTVMADDHATGNGFVGDTYTPLGASALLEISAGRKKFVISEIFTPSAENAGDLQIDVGGWFPNGDSGGRSDDLESSFSHLNEPGGNVPLGDPFPVANSKTGENIAFDFTVNALESIGKRLQCLAQKQLGLDGDEIPLLSEAVPMVVASGGSENNTKLASVARYRIKIEFAEPLSPSNSDPCDGYDPTVP
jgi:hypothetical protein